jgi:hypothetical protein
MPKVIILTPIRRMLSLGLYSKEESDHGWMRWSRCHNRATVPGQSIMLRGTMKSQCYVQNIQVVFLVWLVSAPTSADKYQREVERAEGIEVCLVKLATIGHGLILNGRRRRRGLQLRSSWGFAYGSHRGGDSLPLPALCAPQPTTSQT